MNKYKYLLVIQQYYYNCWEDCSKYEANSQGRAKDKRLIHEDKKNYLLLGYPTRVVFRKEKNSINQ